MLAVESANGRLKTWKFLANVVTNTQVPFTGDHVRIVGSLINAFKPLISKIPNSVHYDKEHVGKIKKLKLIHLNVYSLKIIEEEMQ